MSRAPAICAAVALATAGLGCVDAPLAERQSRHIVGGAPSTDPTVVAIGLRRLRCESSFEVLCSGVVVAPRVVLTAAHCFEGVAPAAQLELYAGDDPATGGEYRYIVDRVSHPAFSPDTFDADLALLLLDEPLQVAPATLPSAPLDDSSIGASLRIVGFGTDDATRPADAVKREGTGLVTAVENDKIRFEPDPAMSCTGDSGGPGFLEIGGGPVVSSVASSGDPLCAEFGVNTRVDLYVDGFIQPYIDDAADATSPAPTVSDDALCQQACAEDADCPHHMRCTDTAQGPRCVLGELPAGALGEPCTATEDECSPCVRVAASGEAACRRYLICEGGLLPQCEPDGGCGCAAADPAAGGHGAPLLIALALALAWVARQRLTRR